MPTSPTFVQSNSLLTSASVSSTAVPYTNAQIAQDCNLVCISYTSAATAISSVTDTAGNIYSLALMELFDSAFTKRQVVYICPNIAASLAGANTVTVNFSLGVTKSCIEIVEYSNVNNAAPIDGSVPPGSDVNELNPSSGAFTTAFPNDTIVSFIVISSAATLTVPTGYTFRLGAVGTLNGAADGPAVTAGSHTTTWNLGGARNYILHTLALTPPPLPPTVTTLPANAIRTTSAALNGLLTSSGSGTTTTFGFNWGLTSSYGTTITSTGVLKTTQSFLSSISGLTDNTVYHYQSFAVTQFGTATSADASFTTNQIFTPPTIVGSNPAAVNTFTLSPTFSDEFVSPLSLYSTTWGSGTWQSWFYFGGQFSTTGRGESAVSCLFSDTLFNGINPFSIAGSNLSIKADNNPAYPSTSSLPFTSGTLTTQQSFSQLYGYFECRCQNPVGVGLWPAFWMLSTTLQAKEEIDVMEDFAVGNTISSTWHYLVPTPHQGLGVAVPVNDTTQFHTYGFLWAADYLYFYVDRVQSTVSSNVGFHDAMYLILTMQTGAQGSFLGFPSGNIPANFVVDYVRAYSISSVSSVPIALSLPTLTNQAATFISSSTATLTGTIVSDGGGPSSVSGFNYGFTTVYGSTILAGPLDTGPFSTTVTGLVANTLYHYQAFATNAAGTGTSSDLTFTTLSTAPPPGPPTVTAQAPTFVGTGTVTLNGTITLDGGSISSITGFIYGPTTSYGNGITNGAVDTGLFSATALGLTPNTLYHCQAFASNSTGTGMSADFTFSTLPLPRPTAPTVTIHAATFVSSGSVTFNGTIILDGGSVPSIAGFHYGVTTAYGNTVTSGPLDTGPFSATATGLTPSTVYHYQAFATNSAGTGISTDNVAVTLFAPTFEPAIPLPIGGAAVLRKGFTFRHAQVQELVSPELVVSKSPLWKQALPVP